MKKKYLFLFCFISSFLMGYAQQSEISVTGIVVDQETGMPLPTVNVIEKGTNNGVLTNFDGEYTIDVPSDATLQFSYLGFETLEIPIDARSTIDINLQAVASDLGEVIVVGYGTQERRKVTGAVEKVDGETINETPVLTIDNALAGRVPGLTVNQNNAEPGRDDARLLVRGVGTTGDNSPLIVIDGVANRGGFSRLDPNDVESVTVLKDASAAIYGAQAANGVILVTTKRGKEGKTIFNYSYNRAFVSPTRDIDLADADLYARSVNILARQSGQESVYSQEQIDGFANGSLPSTNWTDAVYMPSSSQERQNLSLRGGSEKLKYFSSFGTAYQEGLVRGDEKSGFKQYNFRANFDAQVTDNLNIRLDLAGRTEERTFLQYEDETIYSNTVRGAPDIPALINGMPARGREALNPLAIAQGPGYLRQRSDIFNGLINVDYDIPYVEGLSVSGWMSVDINSDQRKHFFQPFTYYEENEEGEVVPVQAGPAFQNNYLRLDDINRRSYTYNANLNYKTLIDDEHTVSAFLAYEQNKINADDFWTQRNGFQTDQIDQLFAGSADSNLQSNNGSATVVSRQNYFGRLSYDYKSKYIAQFVFRYDGSSIFPEGDRFGFFPGIEAAWRISEENFFKDNIEVVNELK